MEIVLDRIESYQAKDYAMRTLTHLLRLGTNRNLTWYGPIFQERISGLKLNGEASLLPFLGKEYKQEVHFAQKGGGGASFCHFFYEILISYC